MSSASKNSFGTRETLTVDGKPYEIFRLTTLEKKGIGHVAKLPFSLRVLLENLLRQEDERFVNAKDIEALASWNPTAASQQDISFMPARVLLQTLPAFRPWWIWPRCAKQSSSSVAIPRK